MYTHFPQAQKNEAPLLNSQQAIESAFEEQCRFIFVFGLQYYKGKVSMRWWILIYLELLCC